MPHGVAFLHSDLLRVHFLLSDFIQPPWLHWLFPTGLISSQQSLDSPFLGPGCPLPQPPQHLSLAGTSQTDGAVTRKTCPGSSKRDAGFKLGGMLAVLPWAAGTRPSHEPQF